MKYTYVGKNWKLYYLLRYYKCKKDVDSFLHENGKI